MKNFLNKILLICTIILFYGCKYDSKKEVELIATTEVLPMKITESMPQRLIHLSSLVIALEKYKRKNHAYPASTKRKSEWYWDGDYQNQEWIKGLAPDYINELPKDDDAEKYQKTIYSYISNGANYKLIIINTDDCNEIITLYPQLKDRGRTECAYGYWTPVAAGWRTDI